MSYELVILGEKPPVDSAKVAEAKEALDAIQQEMKATGSDGGDPYRTAYFDHQRALRPWWRKYKHPIFTAFRQVMVETGMGRWTSAPEINEVTEDEPAGNLDALADQLEAQRAQLTMVLPEDEGVGIPLHKFSSNDMWIVTATECGEAITAWEEADQSALDAEVQETITHERWQDFIELLRWASRDGGLGVY
ncbi:hypothetical protein [Glutamicibacter ardleyensis]|uniref:hypothetical protein n=1 Tax=Glutamicibacter ardleyensis TaxID=225894 RepID=UPI003FD1D5D4